MLALIVCAQISAPIVPPTPSAKDYGLIARLLAEYEDDYYIRYGEVYGGKVIAVTKDTITVQKPGRIPRTFPVAPPLCSDRIPLEWTLGTGHRMRDIRLGDLVGFDLARGRDGYVCIAIGIYRRPGGIIPPAEDDHLPFRSRLHNRCNAAQWIEETLIPALRDAKIFPQLFADR